MTQTKDKEIKATKIDVLLFIKRMEIVTIWDVIDQFDYSYGGANKRLHRLRREKLVEHLDRGQWILTNEGYRRLEYYGQQ